MTASALRGSATEGSVKAMLSCPMIGPCTDELLLRLALMEITHNYVLCIIIIIIVYSDSIAIELIAYISIPLL